MKLKIIAGLVVLALFAILFASIANIKDSLEVGARPGPTVTDRQEWLAGGSFGASGTWIKRGRVFENTSFNPGSVSSSTAAETVAFLTPNVTTEDIVLAQVSSATSTNLWRVDAKVTAGAGTATATTTLYFYGVEAAAVNLTTTTARIFVIETE